MNDAKIIMTITPIMAMKMVKYFDSVVDPFM